jgi:hypothetical protein
MLAGKPATEQCIVIDGVNFLNNADLDGDRLPPAGAPNIMMAAGGTQLKKVFDDDETTPGRFTWIGTTRQTPRRLGRRRSPSLHITICATAN